MSSIRIKNLEEKQGLRIKNNMKITISSQTAVFKHCASQRWASPVIPVQGRTKTEVPSGSRVTSLNLRSYNSNWHPNDSPTGSRRAYLDSVSLRGIRSMFSKEIGRNKEAVARIYPRFWQRTTRRNWSRGHDVRVRLADPRRLNSSLPHLSRSFSQFFNFHRRKRQPRELPPRLDFRQEE